MLPFGLFEYLYDLHILYIFNYVHIPNSIQFSYIYNWYIYVPMDALPYVIRI